MKRKTKFQLGKGIIDFEIMLPIALIILFIIVKL